MSVLVVDDNSLLLSKIVRSFARNRRTVRSAGSLAQARTELANERPQVLCLDLHLPDGNGFELVEELRAANDDLPVVVISGHHEEDFRARADTLGVTEFLAKPFSLHKLNALLDDLLPAGSAAPHDAAPTVEAVPAGRTIVPLDSMRALSAKRSFTTRRVNLTHAAQLITAGYAPRAGDVLLARLDRPRQHCRIELPSGRRAWLVEGDEIIISYGNRYAPDQFEAEVPADLGPCHLVAAGGIASRCLTRHASMKPATEITPIGVLADSNGQPLNLDDFSLARRMAPASRPPVIAVLGTSMNAGKTTAAANLALGLRQAGFRIGSAKVTGSGAGGDFWRLLDAGAVPVMDFTDAGHASTYLLEQSTCESIMETLIAELCDAHVDVILIEVADGVLQQETQALVQSATFARLVDNVVFAAGDALGAANGAHWLEARGLPVAAISGALTASPLAIRECQAQSRWPVVTRSALRQAEWLPPCIGHSAEPTANASA